MQSCCISGIKEKAHNIFDGDKEIGVLVFQLIVLMDILEMEGVDKEIILVKVGRRP
ncbi:MAG: hypothetical protein V3U40_06205 [Candidatus Scalindua sediminis]